MLLMLRQASSGPALLSRVSGETASGRPARVRVLSAFREWLLRRVERKITVGGKGGKDALPGGIALGRQLGMLQYRCGSQTLAIDFGGTVVLATTS
jgi:hypothetical protein